MKKKIFICLMAASLLCGSISVPISDIHKETTIASAALYDTVPEGYTGIYTIDDLYAVRNNLSGDYILMNDIDMSETAPGGDWDNGNGWLPIDSFTGTFDGNGHAIKNMHIYGTTGGYLGLFGNSSGRITKVALVDCDIDITVPSDSIVCVGSIIGGYSGYSYPQTTYCYATGTIKVVINCSSYAVEDYFIGGIAGDAKVDNSFNNCDIYVSVSNDNSQEHPDYKNYFNVGGITGYSGHVLRGGSSYSTGKCLYNAGTIDIKEDGGLGEYRIGNIFARSAGSVASGYALSYSYYLKTLNNYTASDLYSDNYSYYNSVAGLTAGQMKSKSAFTGFDFDEVWTIDPNAEYPYPTLSEVPYVGTHSSVVEPIQTTTIQTTKQTITTTTKQTTITTTIQSATQPPASTGTKKGDMNGDGLVDAVDASVILAYYAYLSTGGTIDDIDEWMQNS